MKKPISFLLTLDVHEMDRLDEFIDASLRELESLRVKATYYATAHLFARFRNSLLRIRDAGHQLACHGLDHENEFYDLLDDRETKRRIQEATRIFEVETGERPRAFRAPGFRISGYALKVLADEGYTSDCSVNSQRLGITSTYLFDNGWLLSARKPYHPSMSNPFRRGDLGILEVPVSAFGIALTMTFLEVFGPRLFTIFFRTLSLESKNTGKPIVYATHPEDFAPFGQHRQFAPVRLKHFLPSEYGFHIRHRLKEADPRRRFEMNQTFLRNAIGDGSARRFLTLDEYVSQTSRTASAYAAPSATSRR